MLKSRKLYENVFFVLPRYAGIGHLSPTGIVIHFYPSVMCSSVDNKLDFITMRNIFERLELQIPGKRVFK